MKGFSSMPTPLGTCIKNLRKQRGLTLAEVSEKTKLSLGFLSNLERNETSPTIANLQKICDALGITINDILEDHDDSKTAVVVRAGERKPLFEQPSGALSYSSVTRGTTVIKVSSMTLAGNETVQFAPHDHDELGIIESGTMELKVANETYELNPGDSIYIHAGTLHSGKNVGEVPCKSYWIKTDPPSRVEYN